VVLERVDFSLIQIRSMINDNILLAKNNKCKYSKPATAVEIF
jgi:hypothetical protein